MNEAFTETFARYIGSIRALALSERNAADAITLGRIYGAIRWRNSDGVYADGQFVEAIEDLIFEDGKIDLAQYKATSYEGYVLLASELYDSGGHSPVVIKWLELMTPRCPHKLVVTRSITESIRHQAVQAGAKVIKCQGHGYNKVIEILEASRNCSCIVLHIHPDDIIAAVAARLLVRAGYFCIFYNHADHAFSFGIESAHTVCEISNYGIALSKRSGRVQGRQFYLGIPLESKCVGNDKSKSPIKKSKGQKLIVSCGSSWKYRPNGDLSFFSFIGGVLSQVPDSKVVLVGPERNDPWWKDMVIKWKDRLELTGNIPYWKYLSLLESAGVYVDSYPVTGGTAFPEALVRGVPCVGLENSVQGYSEADRLRVTTPRELVRRVSRILAGDAEELQRISDTRIMLISSSGHQAFQARLNQLYERHFEVIESSDVGSNTTWFEKGWLAGRKIHCWSFSWQLSILLRLKLVWFTVKVFKIIEKRSGLSFLARLACLPKAFIMAGKASIKDPIP